MPPLLSGKAQKEYRVGRLRCPSTLAKLKSESQKYVELKEEDYLLLVENTVKMEALKIAGAGIEKMPIYKAMEHILQHQHIDLMVKPVSRKYS